MMKKLLPKFIFMLDICIAKLCFKFNWNWGQVCLFKSYWKIFPSLLIFHWVWSIYLVLREPKFLFCKSFLLDWNLSFFQISIWLSYFAYSNFHGLKTFVRPEIFLEKYILDQKVLNKNIFGPKTFSI